MRNSQDNAQARTAPDVAFGDLSIEIRDDSNLVLYLSHKDISEVWSYAQQDWAKFWALLRFMVRTGGQ